MIRSVVLKLKASSGETMVEALVSVLISALAILLLATAIGTAVNLVITSKDQMGTRYRNESELISSSAGTSDTVKFGVPLRRNDYGALLDKEDVTVHSSDNAGATYYEPKGV